MRTHPFQVGDTPYHLLYGKCKVVSLHTSDTVSIATQEGQLGVYVKLLSFSPWPAPDHSRPIRDGWWLVKNLLGSKYKPRVLQVKDGKYVLGKRMIAVKNSKMFLVVRYLGEDLE